MSFHKAASVNTAAPCLKREDSAVDSSMLSFLPRAQFATCLFKSNISHMVWICAWSLGLLAHLTGYVRVIAATLSVSHFCHVSIESVLGHGELPGASNCPKLSSALAAMICTSLHRLKLSPSSCHTSA